MMNKKYIKILVVCFILLVGITGVSAHGVDVTADKMVIANDTNGQLVKDIADSNGINISVYKFTSDDEVEHQLEHMLNNTNKSILVVSYQSTAHDFLNKHPEVSDRLQIVDDVNNQTVVDGIKAVESYDSSSQNNSTTSFGLPLLIGLIIGVIVGLGCGIYLMKRKDKTKKE